MTQPQTELPLHRIEAPEPENCPCGCGLTLAEAIAAGKEALRLSEVQRLPPKHPPVRHTCEKCGESWEGAHGPSYPTRMYMSEPVKLCSMCADDYEAHMAVAETTWLSARKAH